MGRTPFRRPGPSGMSKLSPDEAALLKAVCADRDADLPRLVYADYLDDHGRSTRAEFIRLQCELARRRPDRGRMTHRDHVTYYQQQMRADELLAAHGTRWGRELPKWAADARPEFSRGFVERVWVPASPFLLYGPQVLDRTPLVAVELSEVRNVLDELVRCPWLREVPRVDLAGEQIGTEAGVRLAEAEWLVGTRELVLRTNAFGDGVARALSRCRHLTGLRRLDLSNNELYLPGLQALAASSYLSPDCELLLSGNPALLREPEAARRLFGPRARLG